MVSVIIGIVILLAYTIALCINGGGVPASLSASVFNLPQNRRWIWSLVIFAVCFLCVPTYVERTGENTQFLAFIAIGALAFVGAAPLVKDHQDIAYKVHCVAAVICAVCSQAVLAFNYAYLLLAWIPFVFIYTWMTKEGKWRTMTFWAEFVCFGTTFAFCLV